MFETCSVRLRGSNVITQEPLLRNRSVRLLLVTSALPR